MATAPQRIDGGLGAFFDTRQAQLDEEKKYAPTDEAPEVDAPDLTNYQEVKNSTDRALADGFFRHYLHLFVNGDGVLHIYRKETGSWSKQDVETKILANCIQLADQFYIELGDVRNARTLAERELRADEAVALGQRAVALTNLILLCEKSATISNVAKLVRAKLVTLLDTRRQQMNRDEYIIACRNGVVDLRTGVVRSPRPDDYITRNTNNVYKHDAEHQWWDDVVEKITNHNPRLKDFLQIWAGYCATGSTKEHCMSFWHGGGRNGKNLLVDAIAGALGGYAQSLPSSFLEFTGKDNGSSDNNLVYALAQLEGCRFAYISETGDKGRMRESMVKSQTGDKTIRARLAHKDFNEFTVTHKLTVCSNHKPSVSGTDDGIWSRIRLVPFNTIFGSEAKVEAGIAQYIEDKDLLERARSVSGREAVLAWVIEGAKKYIAHGFDRYLPPEIIAETLGYRREQDVLGQFLSDISEHVPVRDIARVAELEGGGANSNAFAKLSMDQRLRIEKQELWRIYSLWAEQHGHHAMSSTTFARRVTGAQRFWIDEGGDELVMKPLEAIRVRAAHLYKYIRLSEAGRALRNEVRGAQNSTKPSRRGGDEPDF